MSKIKKVYIIGVLLLTSLSAIFLYFGTTFKIERKLLYNENGDIDYKVYLKPNDYYDSNYLDKDKKYIASLIDHIDVNYKYNFKSNYKMNYKYNYYILATSSVIDKNDKNKVIYEKQKYLLDTQTKEISDADNINLNENLSINYDEYNNIIKDFTSKFNISGTDNKLNLSLCISLEGQSEGFENLIVDKSFLNLDIPLTDQTIGVDMDYKEIDSNGEKLDVSSNKVFNIIFFALFAISAVLDVLLIIFITKLYLKFREEELPYERERNKILYQYNRVISKVEDFVVELSYKLVELNSFEALLNVRDSLDRPILYVESEDRQISNFMVLDENVLYRFTLNGEDLNNK